MTSRPLVVLNFEDIGSMYFSGSEHNFAEILAAVRKIPGAILFIDEADAMFPGRTGKCVPACLRSLCVCAWCRLGVLAAQSRPATINLCSFHCVQA